jgi:uncharacterized protein (DUF2141 family)
MPQRSQWQVRLLSRFFIITAFVLLQEISLGQDSAEGADLTGTLTVHVRGLMSGDGNLRFVLFDSKKNFLKHPVRAEVVEIKDRQGTWTIEELPYGTYAVLVHHDIDTSSTMERHWYGKPKEPTGVSNDAPAKFGPPKFEKAKFQFESPTLTLTVTVK